MNKNQHPEQRARDQIDGLLNKSSWIVQSSKTLNFNVGPGIAVREYQTAVGPVDYALFVDKKPLGVIEAKPETWGQKITTVEEQSANYAGAKLKYVNNPDPLPFTKPNGRNPAARCRSSFHFERDDLEMAPFDAQGGLGRMYKLFGEDIDRLIGKLNKALVA